MRRLAKALLDELLPGRPWDLGIYLVNRDEIRRLNETFLDHEGATDVITFDYGDEQEQTEETGMKTLLSPFAPVKNEIKGLVSARPARPLHGEIFICPVVAVAQARRFRTTWQAELVRYVVHGVLHLLGYDDSRPGDRRKMKREENRLLRLLTKLFDVRSL